MKRVLIISFDFPPQGGTGTIRVTKFAKYLPKFGWQPVVVCSDTLWNPDAGLARDVSDVPVHRVGWPCWMETTLANHPKTASGTIKMPDKTRSKTLLKQKFAQAIRRVLVPDVNVLWLRKAYQTCLHLLNKTSFDAIMTTSPPNSIHIIGYKLHTRLGIPWLADFRDSWTIENLVLQRLGVMHFARQRWVERRMLETCDRAVMVTERLTRQTQDTFGPSVASKCLTITNGFDPEDFTGPPPMLEHDRFVIAYVGTILGPQVDNAFPDALRLALKQSAAFRNAVQIRFVGQVAPDYHIRFEGLEDHVKISGFVAHDDAVEVMRRAHVLLLVLPNTKLASMTFTNKFFEYLAAQRPILALTPEGIISDIVTQEKIGSVAPPDDAPTIAKTLLALFESVQTQPDAYCPSETLLARFDRRQLTGKLAGLLSEVARSEP